MASSTDTEKGIGFSAATELNAPMTPLQLFQLLVGIQTPSTLKQTNGIINAGLYQRAREEERRQRFAYITTSFISNSLFLVQIMLAATFTGLSAYEDTNRVTLTVLGALNTVLAGCLAWQKGQGVPHRYRQAQDHYQALLLDIEMTERAFVENASMNPHAERERLQKIFDTAKADQAANYPDSYISTAAKEAKELSKQLEDAKTEAARTQRELLTRIEALLTDSEGSSPAKADQKQADIIVSR